MQEFVRLSQNLRNKSVLVKIFDIEDFPAHLIALMSGLIDVRNEVLVLEIDSPEFSVVVLVLVKLWRTSSAVHFLLVFFIDFPWRQTSRSKRVKLVIFTLVFVHSIKVSLRASSSSEAVRR